MSNNNPEQRKSTVAKAVATAITLGVAASAVAATASANPFQLNQLDGGYMQIAMEGGCGEGKCGGDKAKSKEGSCGGAA